MSKPLPNHLLVNGFLERRNFTQVQFRLALIKGLLSVRKKRENDQLV